MNTEKYLLDFPKIKGSTDFPVCTEISTQTRKSVLLLEKKEEYQKNRSSLNKKALKQDNNILFE